MYIANIYFVVSIETKNVFEHYINVWQKTACVIVVLLKLEYITPQNVPIPRYSVYLPKNEKYVQVL